MTNPDPQKNQPNSTSSNLLDSLRQRNRPTGDIIPPWVLAVTFGVVWLGIIWLMFPPFPREFTRFMSLYHQTRGQYEQAVPYLERLLRDDLSSEKKKQGLVTDYSELGNAWRALGDYDKAIDYFTQAQASIPYIPKDDEGRPMVVVDFNTDLGVSYMKKGDIEKAEEHFRKGLAFDKLDRQANFYMGEIEFQKEKLAAASEHFKMVAHVPNYKDKVQDYLLKIEKGLFAEVDKEPVPKISAELRPGVIQAPASWQGAAKPSKAATPSAPPEIMGTQTVVGASNAATVTLNQAGGSSATSASAEQTTSQ